MRLLAGTPLGVHSRSTSAENAGTVVAICQQLDGVPLALEQAAALLKVLAVEQLAARIRARAATHAFWPGESDTRPARASCGRDSIRRSNRE